MPRSFTGSGITYTAGSIAQTDQFNFERLIYRCTKGKVLAYFSKETFKLIDENKYGRDRLVYVIVFEKGNFL